MRAVSGVFRGPADEQTASDHGQSREVAIEMSGRAREGHRYPSRCRMPSPYRNRFGYKTSLEPSAAARPLPAMG